MGHTTQLPKHVPSLASTASALLDKDFIKAEDLLSRRIKPFIHSLKIAYGGTMNKDRVTGKVTTLNCQYIMSNEELVESAYPELPLNGLIDSFITSLEEAVSTDPHWFGPLSVSVCKGYEGPVNLTLAMPISKLEE